MGAEAVVFVDPGLGDQAKWIRKATTQLMSKHRYLAAQFIALLSDDQGGATPSFPTRWPGSSVSVWSKWASR